MCTPCCFFNYLQNYISTVKTTNSSGKNIFRRSQWTNLPVGTLHLKLFIRETQVNDNMTVLPSHLRQYNNYWDSRTSFLNFQTTYSVVLFRVLFGFYLRKCRNSLLNFVFSAMFFQVVQVVIFWIQTKCNR